MLLRLFFALFLIIGVNLSANEGKIIGASEHQVPSWFKDSFLDIAEDIEEATSKNKHLMLFLDFSGCPYCSKMLKESFEEYNETSQFIKKNFDVIELNVKGSRELTWVDGEVFAEKDLTSRLKIQYSPTVLILSPDNEVIARVNGYRNPVDFKYILDYAHNKEYDKKVSLNSYLETISKKESYSFKNSELFSNEKNLVKVTKPVAIIVEDKNCTQCDYFYEKILTNSDVKDEFSKYVVVRVDANSTENIVLPDGKKVVIKDFINSTNIDYRPAVLLYDDRKLISTIDALLFPFHFKEVLRYVSNKEYIKYPNSYLDYLKVRQDELLKQGIDINIAE